jgi:hypothetical protein
MDKKTLTADFGQQQSSLEIPDDAHSATAGAAVLAIVGYFARWPCRKPLMIPTARPVGCAEHRADGVFNDRVGLEGDLRQRLQVRLAHLDR